MNNGEINLFYSINKVVSDDRISNFDIRVYLGLICFNGKNEPFPKLTTLAKKINRKSIPDISKSLNKLSKLGYIKIKHRYTSSNKYFFNGISDLSGNKINNLCFSNNKTGIKNKNELEDISYFPKC